MSKIKKQNRRAFTLTELLIVVIVIGVLSAVTLPKFNRVIENRKVTEAEEMMSAVRTEQERRCTLDQNYTTNFSALSDVIASANTKNYTYNTKNYTYSLQAQGISAKSTSGDYTLKILSYEDGSYCCTGDGCKKLNKNYPDCATLNFPTSNCVGTEGGTTPPGGEPTPPGGEPTPVEPVEPEEPECADGEVQGSQTCNGCGTQTTQKCVGGKWVASLGECSKTQEECSTCTEGETRNGTTPCLNGCGVELQQCINGEWKGVNCALKPGAECPVGYEQKTQCSDGKSFSIKRCNSSCKFEEIQACPGLDCSNATYKASHKAECCPGTPTTDAICWTQSYSWGPRKSIPVDTTVTYNALYVQSAGSDRCNSSFALRYQSIYPDVVGPSAGMVRCPGNDDASVKGKSCYIRHTESGPQKTVCFYSLGSGYEYSSGVGFRGCKVINGRNGDTCECTINAWPGHECVANEPQKNGW